MIRCLKAIGLAAVVALPASPAMAIDPFFPSFGNDGIDVATYDISLDVDPVTGAIAASAALSIRAEKPLARFSLDLHGLAVSAVSVDGKAVAFRHRADKLLIELPTSLVRGQRFKTVVSYGGVPAPLTDPTAPGDDLYLGWFKYRRSAYVVSEPVGASTFFPANDEPTDKARYAFHVTVPRGFTAVANGNLLSVSTRSDGHEFHWFMDEPMTSWLATVHVNRLSLLEGQTAGGLPLRTYYPEGVPPEHAEVYHKAGRMIGFFEARIGRYPFKSYGSVVVEDPILYYALETQAVSTFPAGSRAPDEALVAHELAHQWFGNSVSVAKWEDLWIAEGSATYFEVLWDHRGDPAGFDAAMHGIYDYVAGEALGPAVVEAPDQLFSDRTYYRGAAALYALRQTVGDGTFFTILRRFVQDNRGGNVTSEAFIRTAVRWSGDAAVRDLLEAWLYDQEVPALPGEAPRPPELGRAARPDIIGGRCGPMSHRGAPRLCS